MRRRQCARCWAPIEPWHSWGTHRLKAYHFACLTAARSEDEPNPV